jgi:two-component system nitrogen regulation sensor histidine kinase NtrY
MRAAIRVSTDELVARVKLAATRSGVALQRLAHAGLDALWRAWNALQRAWRDFRRPAPAAPADPLAPLVDDALQLPGTSPRAFRTGAIVVTLSVISGLATYLILTGLAPVVPTNEVVLGALVINGLLVIAMVAVIAVQVLGLWGAWKQRVAGARMHARIVALFSVIAAIPALLLAVAATTTFSRALDSWFNQQTQAIVQNSLNVGEAYLLEHGQVIRTDIVLMAKDLDEAAGQLKGDPRGFRELMIGQAMQRDLPVAYVIDAKGNVKTAVLEDERIPYLPPPARMIEAANGGHIPLLMPLAIQGLDAEQIPYELLPANLVRDAQRARVAALTKLKNYPDSYLYVARGVDAKVVGHLRRTLEGVDRYRELRRARGGLQLAHGLLYFMISLTALFAAIWVGLWFAGQFVAPIRRLISAAQEVARGNLEVELPIRRGEGDMRRLSMNFNAMTKELQSQRTELMDANSQLTERRRFMEAVLSGVSAGVIGLDRHDRVTLANRSAERLLGCTEADLVGRELPEVVPEFAGILAEARENKGRPQHHVKLTIGGEERSFSVRVTSEEQGGADQGVVVTFDDISELVSAQRTSAWGDVARRIAHEIKNPLTPIQLSAERIKRKYGKVIGDDREVFDQCTDTIIRRVDEVTRMVNSFAQFARMPKPQMEDHDIRQLVRSAVLERQMMTSNVIFDTKLGAEPIVVHCDRELIAQAVVNLVKNAAEAIQTFADSGNAESGWRGRVVTVVRRSGDTAVIEVMDNGPGLPKHNRNQLLEPYVSTKGSKGMGLGLAIVLKSVENHGGTLALDDAPLDPERAHGALIRITLPISKGQASQPIREDTPEPAAVGGGQ